MLGRPDLVGQTVGRVLAGPTESRGGPNPPKATRFPRQDSVGQTGGPTGSRTAGWTESDGRAAAGRSDGPDPSPTGSDRKLQPSRTEAPLDRRSVWAPGGRTESNRPPVAGTGSRQGVVNGGKAPLTNKASTSVECLSEGQVGLSRTDEGFGPPVGHRPTWSDEVRQFTRHA